MYLPFVFAAVTTVVGYLSYKIGQVNGMQKVKNAVAVKLDECIDHLIVIRDNPKSDKAFSVVADMLQDIVKLVIDPIQIYKLASQFDADKIKVSIAARKEKDKNYDSTGNFNKD